MSTILSLPSNFFGFFAEAYLMKEANVSKCGRYIVVNGIFLDREVFESTQRFATERRLGIDEAIQLALCSFQALLDEEAGQKGEA